MTALKLVHVPISLLKLVFYVKLNDKTIAVGKEKI